MKLLGLAVIAAATVTCCDPQHDGYVTSQENIKICVSRGGVPISAPVLDSGNHAFQVLKHCEFPYEQRPTVEKRQTD